MQSEEIIVDRFDKMDVDLAEEARGAAEERIAIVIIVIRVVLHRIIFQSVQQELQLAIFPGKPGITSERVEDVDRRIGVVWA